MNKTRQGQSTLDENPQTPKPQKGRFREQHTHDMAISVVLGAFSEPCTNPRASGILTVSEPQTPQRLQHPLIKEYTLHHIRDPTLI